MDFYFYKSLTSHKNLEVLVFESFQSYILALLSLLSPLMYAPLPLRLYLESPIKFFPPT